MSDPTEIYLQPECCADDGVGRIWCDHDAPVDCEDGVPWTKYVLAARVRELEAERDALRAEHAEAERDALRAEVERLRGALDRAARTLRGETGCEDQGQAYDTAQRIIDAALAAGTKEGA